MIGKIWKKVLVLVLIIACLFNVVRILVQKVPLLQELQATLNSFIANVGNEENTASNNTTDNTINQNVIQNSGQINQNQLNSQQQIVQPQGEQQNLQQQQVIQNQQQIQNNGQVQPHSDNTGVQQNNQGLQQQDIQDQQQQNIHIQQQQNTQIQQQQNNQSYLDRMYQRSNEQNQNFLMQVQGQTQN